MANKYLNIKPQIRWNVIERKADPFTEKGGWKKTGLEFYIDAQEEHVTRSYCIKLQSVDILARLYADLHDIIGGDYNG